METRDNSSRETAESQRPAAHSSKFCPLCRTLNHSLSRECFNCGWCGGFSVGSADVPDPWIRRSHSFLSACGRKLRLWLY